MIYLYHRPLLNILAKGGRLHLDDRAAMMAHRDDRLGKFCQTHDLPSPVIQRHHHGKPFCANIPLAFNQSHSQTHYALVYALGVKDLGVDVENINRQVRMVSLAQRYFHVDEWAYWQAQNLSRLLWFRIWTIKEAVLKAHGLGIRLDLKTLNTNIEHGQPDGRLTQDGLGEFYYQCFVFESSVLTVAYRWGGVVHEICQV